jgi:transposase
MDTTTWYGNQTEANVEGRNIGTLALIAPLLERMNVAQIINQHLPADPQAEYDYGNILSVLIAARMFSPLGLVNVGNWAAESGAELLWNIPADKLNDDRLGKALDAFFTQRHSILASFALHVSQELGVPLSEVHYDPTHILFEGAYEESQPRDVLPADVLPADVLPADVLPADETIPSDEDMPAAHITKGRPMEDAAHGGRMVHAGLCTLVDEFGPLPIYGHTVSGNQNGRSAVAEQFALIQKHLRPTELTMISDRGTYSTVHLARMKREGFDALCSAPWNAFRRCYDEHREALNWNHASYLSIEQQRRRTQGDLPREHYELAVLRHRLTDPQTKQDFPVRLIYVFSTADERVTRQQRTRQIDKIRLELLKIQQSVASGNRNTDPASITRRVERVFGAKQSAKYCSYEMVPLTIEQQAKLPAPGRGHKRPTHRFAFHFNKALQKQDEQYDGLNVLVTTAMKRPIDDLFTKFKQQTYAEHANHIFKGPLAVRPVFLKNPNRVEALVFLLMMSLTLYFVLQRTYRATCEDDAPTKDRRKTSRTILNEFSVFMLLITRTESGRVVQPLQPNPVQRSLLQRLRLSTPAQLLRRRLPRPPT